MALWDLIYVMRFVTFYTRVCVGVWMCGWVGVNDFLVCNQSRVNYLVFILIIGRKSVLSGNIHSPIGRKWNVMFHIREWKLRGSSPLCSESCWGRFGFVELRVSPNT